MEYTHTGYHARAQKKANRDENTFEFYLNNFNNVLLITDASQIRKDLPRTFQNISLPPEIRNDEKRYEHLLSCLFHILCAFVARRLFGNKPNHSTESSSSCSLQPLNCSSPGVYIQGMNFLAGMLLASTFRRHEPTHKRGRDRGVGDQDTDDTNDTDGGKEEGGTGPSDDEKEHKHVVGRESSARVASSSDDDGYISSMEGVNNNGDKRSTCCVNEETCSTITTHAGTIIMEEKSESPTLSSVVPVPRREKLEEEDNFLEPDEATAFWLLCYLLEDVMDVHFFSVTPVVLLGYQAMRLMLKNMAHKCGIQWIHRLGKENFDAVLDMLLSQWLFTLFINALHFNIVAALWLDIIEDGSVRKVIAWTLGILNYSEAQVKDYFMEPLEAFLSITQVLREAEDVDALLAHVSLAEADIPSLEALLQELATRKQHVVSDASDPLGLSEQTHFSPWEIRRMEEEFERLSVKSASISRGVDQESFYEVVSNVSPTFPKDIVGPLFELLDQFETKQTLSFKEVLVGMSVLSRGTMDQKLRLTFDLFDAKRRGVLAVSEMVELCALLFRLEARGSKPSSLASLNESSEDFETMSLPSYITKSSSKMAHVVSKTFLYKLLMAARPADVGSYSCPAHFVDFQGFRQAALSEPRLLRVFSWCLPPEPCDSDNVYFAPFVNQERRQMCTYVKRIGRFLFQLCTSWS